SVRMAIAYDSTNDRYGIVWTRAGKVKFAVGSKDTGMVTSPVDVNSGSSADNPSMVYNSTTGRFAIAWDETVGGVSRDVRMALVNASTGALVASSEIAVTNSTTANETEPTLRWDGSSEFGITFTDDRNGASQKRVFFRRVKVASPPVLITTGGSPPS